MAVQTGGSSSKPSTPDDTNLGRNKKTVDPLDFGFDFKDISPETIENIKKLIDSANSLMTQAEREYNEEVKRKDLERKKKFDEAIEIETRKEVFEIPRKSGKTYRFLGYDTEQYKEIMNLGNKADKMEDKSAREYFDLEEEVFLKTVRYSLEHMSDDVLKKLPRKDLFWYYLVMKSKNENPLPFEVNA